MIRGLFRFVLGVLRFVGRAFDFVARGMFYLLVALVLGIFVALFMQPAPQVPKGAALVLRPVGTIVERVVFDEPLTLLRAGGVPGGRVVLAEQLEAIRAARDDDRIAALVIETDRLGGGGLSKLAELREAIAAFKASGKPVLARGDDYDQAQYYLASVADEVHLSPDGFVLLRGLARYGMYFKDALDKLGIKVHVFRVGEYKSFAEPFTRNDMSEEDRIASRDLLEGLWTLFRDDVGASRKLADGALDAYVDGYRDALAATRGDAARAALDAGLVDRLSTRDQWRDRLVERVGRDAEGKDFRRIELDAYLVAVRRARPAAGERIAVIVAQGSIIDGEEPAGVVAGDTYARLIRKAREDDSVKAVLLRIDSPGGSAFASELIRRELELTREAGKPVVASMSSVAASGGYWIAAGADEIWAAPATLTGSIGIFALFPEIAEPLKRLGVSVDGVATAPLAAAFDPRRPLDPAAAEAMQLGIEHGYRRFLGTVAQARRMSAEDVDKVGRGRVWTGQAAAGLGLVDRIGGLEAALAATAQRAGLTRYDVVWPEATESIEQRLMRRLIGLAGEAGLLDTAASAAKAPLAGTLDDMQRGARELMRWNDPQHQYVHCLCESP
ncbi:signal peptide peptidase SppA [Thauera sinica]|uniref:Signal peptide peptidase SppA n=1 Tax=Thauera sinica TaxID=2665146 RepID=A0ABW1ATQ3_9RHOO|nr:signal peptide peptidase SppA [Thauera sp. K11]ATE61910.1 signal peptide peptidase SppA [Thauera sp. K11]